MVPLATLLATLLPTPSVLADNPCQPDESTCQHVYDWTGNARAADLSDALVGKPSALLGIALVGLISVWLLHRVVDRIVRKAEEGVLPDRLSRMTVGRRTTETGESARGRRLQRARTMGGLLKSIITGVVLAVAITMMLA